MADSEIMKSEEVEELVNQRNRNHRQEIPQSLDADIMDVKEKKETYTLSPLVKGVEITYKKDKESVTFVVERFITSGGFSMIYRVNMKLMNNMRPMIIKEFCPRSAVRNEQNHLLFNKEDVEINQSLEDFRKEPKRIKELLVNTDETKWENLNVVIPHTEDTFTCFGNEYYVMEYVPGESLTEFMRNSGEDLSIGDKLCIMDKLCKAVASLHLINCVHQDLSTNNIMVNKVGNSISLKVIDFGICTTLAHKEGQGYSAIRNIGTPGFVDVCNLKTYKVWSDSNDTEQRARLKLIDIYSLGAVLAYVCLLSPEYYSSDKNNGFNVLDSFITKSRCGEEQQVLPEDTPADKKIKVLYNQLRELAIAATHSNVNERIQTVDEFVVRLEDIIGFYNTCSEEDNGQQIALEELLEEEKKKRMEIEKEYDKEIKDYTEKIDGLRKKVEELEYALETKDKVKSQEIQNILNNLQRELYRLKKEKEEANEYLETVRERHEQERNKAEERQQVIDILTNQLEKERHLRQQAGKKYQETQRKNAEELHKLKNLIDKVIQPSPWYEHYKKNLFIIVAVLGIVGVTVGIGSIDWSKRDSQLEESATEVKQTKDTSFSVQSVETEMNAQQLQPEQLTALIQQARQDEKTMRYLEALCAEDVVVLEEKDGVPVKIPFLQLFNKYSNNYPIVGTTHKVAELYYEGGRIKLITLTK